MEYIVIAFRSRAHTLKFGEFLRRNGTYCQIINTPKEAGVGCGLSVRVSVSDLNRARRAVAVAAYPSFAGIFSIKNVRGQRVVRTI